MTPPWHWRRFLRYAIDDHNRTVVASACGRLVDYQEAVGDVDDVDCDECLVLHKLFDEGVARRSAALREVKP
jgi:hypothetical protein